MIIRRLDHPIICIRSRERWGPEFARVLDLRPERIREGDEWGFSNLELAIGDGFLGVVEPAGEGSQLERFLAHFGEGFYGLAVDVGPLDAAARHLDEHGVRYREAKRGAVTQLLWVGPQETHGVVYQLCPGGPASQGTNPRYLGVSEVVVAVRDMDAAVAQYRRVFGVELVEPTQSAALGYTGARLPMPGSALHDALVLAEPAGGDGLVARHLAQRGEGIFQFTIAVADLPGELARLRAVGVEPEVDATGARPARVWVPPALLAGARIELRAHDGAPTEEQPHER